MAGGRRWLLVVAIAACGDNAAPPAVAIPTIDGDWWDVAGNPDLGALNGPNQTPVDFSVWQAADGTWNLWACIRFTLVGGNTRLFFHWQSATLTATDWTPIGIAMEADPAVGEVAGGLQAPYVFRDAGGFHMFYGGWEAICSATSADGLTFTRTLDAAGQCPLFSEGSRSNTRDPMVIRVDDHWQVVYTAFAANGTGAVYARTSQDLVQWSASKIIAFGGIAGTHGSSGESPFMVHRDGKYYLFRTHAYGADAATEVYASRDPLDFGVNDDRAHLVTLPISSPEIFEVGGQSYIAAFKPSTDGYRIAKLRW